jgi:hypothetical protein
VDGILGTHNQHSSHFDLDAFYCQPGIAGAHEKGGVEGQIGWFRRNHLVLVLDVASIEALNAMIDQWDAADEARRIGTRALIEVLLLHRHMAHEHVVAGLAAALRAGALTADAVALEARKAADADDQPAAEEPGPAAPPATVASLTARRLAQLPPDTRPLPSLAAYDHLLRRHRITTEEGTTRP